MENILRIEVKERPSKEKSGWIVSASNVRDRGIDFLEESDQISVFPVRVRLMYLMRLDVRDFKII